MGQNAALSDIQIGLVLAAMAGAVFAVDISIPLGVAGGVPYIAVVLIAAWAPRPVRIILAMAASATLLTIGAYFWSPAGGVPWMVLSNRVLAIFAIWVTAVLILKRRQAEEALRDAAAHLEERVAQRTSELANSKTQLEAEITERIQTEQLLQESEAQLKSTFQSMLDPMLAIDAHGIVQSASRSVERVFGFKPEELVGQNIKILMPEPLHSQHDAYLDAYRRTGKSAIVGQTREFFAVRRDGTWFPCEVTVWKAERAGDDGPLLTGIIRDICERKEAERAIRESEKLFRTLADTAPVFVSINQDFRKVYVNAAAEAMTGYSREEWLKLDSLANVHPDFRELARKRALKRYANEDVPNRYEMKIITKSGEERWIDFTATPIEYNGKPAILGMALDITEQKQVHQTLHELNVDLEKRVVQRTAELKEVNTELGAFAHSVSHDLQAPLRSMFGFAQALLEDYTTQLDAQGKEYAARIIGAANRMDALIQDLLTYSKVSHAELKIEPVELDSVVRESMAHLEAEIELRKARIILEGRFPSVLGDRSTLVRITTNLLSNAMKFVGANVIPRVTIRAESSGDRARLWLEDNGIGIDREHREKIFRVFERLHGVESYPGTGIGLAVVHRAAERMNGQVGVESTPGEGSRFWVDLSNSE